MKIAAATIAFALMPIGSLAHAQAAADAVAASACLARPDQVCLLGEAFELLQSNRSPLIASTAAERQYDLEKIVELHANAGRFADARRVAGAISSRELSRIHALRVIGVAQARAGAREQAADSFDQAHHLIEARDKEPLGQAGALLAMAKAETGAGLTANAARSLAESLDLAVRADVNVSGCISPTLDAGLDGLLQALAEEFAKADDVANAIRAARATGLTGNVRADALRIAAEARTAKAEFAEARALLREAVDVAKASVSRRPSSKCPRQSFQVDYHFHVQQLSRVAVAQGKAGFADDAAATLAEATGAVEAMEAAYTVGLQVRRSQALSEIAEARHAAGLSGSVEAFDSAVKAADAVGDPLFAAAALTRLAQAQQRSGRNDDARTALARALEKARAVDEEVTRAGAYIDVINAKLELGIAADTDVALNDALAVARSTIDRTRFQLQRRIAEIRLRSGATDEAVALFRELLQSVGAINNERPRSNTLVTVIQGWPMRGGGTFVKRVEKPLLAATAHEVVRLAQSVQDARLRASILVMVSEALTD